MGRKFSVTALALAALIAGWGSGYGRATAVAQARHILRDVDGIVHGALESPAGWKWTVLFFVLSDCPISNQYAPEIQRICASYGPDGVRCFLVYPDPSATAPEVRGHLREFNYTLAAILDPSHGLAVKSGATITPETAVFADGELKYLGRINDFYAELGRPRQQVTRHDLRNALDDLIAGRSVANPRTEALGCYIPQPF